MGLVSTFWFSLFLTLCLSPLPLIIGLHWQLVFTTLNKNRRVADQRWFRNVSIKWFPNRGSGWWAHFDPRLEIKRHCGAGRIGSATGSNDPHRASGNTRSSSGQRRGDQPGDEGGERFDILHHLRRGSHVRAAGVPERVRAASIADDRPTDAVQRAGMGYVRVGVCGGGQQSARGV